MGLQLAKAFVTLQLDRSMFDSGLTAVRSNFATSMASIQGAALATLGTVAAGSFKLLTSGFGAAAEVESSLVAFEVFLGTAEKAKQMFEDLRGFAKETPFDLPETVKAARQLLNAGESADVAIESLEYLGNAASGAKANLNELVLIYNQIRGTRNLQEQDFRQLTTRSILSMRDIAKYFKVSLHEAEDMKRAGKIGFEDIRNVFKMMSSEGGKYYQYMEKMTKVFEGAMSNLRDSVGFTLSDIGSGFLKFATPVVRLATMASEGFRQIVEATKPLIPNILASVLAVSSLTGGILALRVAFVLLGLTMKKVLIGTGIGIALVALGVALGLVLTVIEKLWNAFAESEFGATALATASRNLTMAWKALSSFASQLFSALSQLASAFINLVQKVFGVDFMAAGRGMSETLGKILIQMSDFVLNFITMLAALLENWQLIWAKFPLFVKLALSYILDMFRNLFDALPQLVTFSLHLVTMAVIKFGITVIGIMSEILKSMVLLFAKFPKLLTAALMGKDTNKMVEQMSLGIVMAYAKAVKGLGGKAPDLSKVFDMSAGTKKIMKQLDKEIKAIKKSQAKFRAEAAKEEEKRKKEEEDQKGGAGRKGTLPFAVPSGVYDVPGLGRKMQEMLIGKETASKEDKDKRMMELAEVGANAQQEAVGVNRELLAAARGIEEQATESKKEEKEMVLSLRTANTIAKEMLAAIKNMPQGGLV